MRHSILFITGLAGLLAGCGSEALATSDDMQTVYVSVRENAAQGKIAEAAQLTDDPATFERQMTDAQAQMGDAEFRALMAEAASDLDVHEAARSGAYGILILNADFNGRSAKAATFFVDNGGQMLEMVRPTGDVPCELYSKFYAAKGEPDAQPSACR